MTKLTTERLEELANTTTPSVKYVGREIIAMARQLLAYEQAAKNPVGLFANRDGTWMELCSGDSFEHLDAVELFAAPVLPKQPAPTISFYLDGIIAAAQWVEKQREAYDNEHGQHDSDTGFFEFGNDAQRDYSETLAEIAEGIRSLHPASAQPVIPEQWRSFITDADIAALHRFAECCDDPESGGHDLEKEQVQRLEKIGALQRSGRISYITDFGDYLISLTVDERYGKEG